MLTEEGQRSEASQAHLSSSLRGLAPPPPPPQREGSGAHLLAARAPRRCERLAFSTCPGAETTQHRRERNPQHRSPLVQGLRLLLSGSLGALGVPQRIPHVLHLTASVKHL